MKFLPRKKNTKGKDREEEEKGMRIERKRKGEMKGAEMHLQLEKVRRSLSLRKETEAEEGEKGGLKKQREEKWEKKGKGPE